MTPETNPQKTMNEYFAEFPQDVQDILEKVRQTIRDVAPDAQETIKYGIPTFTLNGNLVHFGAFKNHIGFYPAPSGTAKFKNELSVYGGAKGSVKFPLDKPIPYELIAEITKFRIRENLEKAAEKADKRKA